MRRPLSMFPFLFALVVTILVAALASLVGCNANAQSMTDDVKNSGAPNAVSDGVDSARMGCVLWRR
jgi:hypothetical protein